MDDPRTKSRLKWTIQLVQVYDPGCRRLNKIDGMRIMKVDVPKRQNVR